MKEKERPGPPTLLLFAALSLVFSRLPVKWHRLLKRKVIFAGGQVDGDRCKRRCCETEDRTEPSAAAVVRCARLCGFDIEYNRRQALIIGTLRTVS